MGGTRAEGNNISPKAPKDAEGDFNLAQRRKGRGGGMENKKASTRGPMLDMMYWKIRIIFSSSRIPERCSCRKLRRCSHPRGGIRSWQSCRHCGVNVSRMRDHLC